MFRSHVRMAEAPFRNMTGRPLPRYFNLASANGNTATEKSQVFVQEVQQSQSKFDWSFDTCSVVLGNFNYRKMSLVRDFDTLVQDQTVLGNTFDTLFNNEPRAIQADNDVDVIDLFKVIEADPSQDQAISNARNNQSMVIQGPPGTGKSQTITNLIADFIGRGKSVLFVCQKRAALDVVYNRLNSAGLGELTAAFHDSRGNRAEFISELSRLYNKWSETPPAKGVETLEREKHDLIQKINQVSNPIETLVSAMTSKANDDDPALHELITAILADGSAWSEKSGREPVIDDADISLPSLAEWNQHKDFIEQALLAVQRVYGSKRMAEFPESRLTQLLWQHDDLARQVSTRLSQAKEVLHQIIKSLDLQTHELNSLSLDELCKEIDFAETIKPVLQNNFITLLDTSSPEFQSFEQEMSGLSLLKTKAQKSAEAAEFWTLPLEKQEVQSALEIAQTKEGGFFSGFSSEWKRIRTNVQTRTNDNGLSVTQKLTFLLEQLKSEEAYQEAKNTFREKFNSQNPETIMDDLNKVRSHELYQVPEIRNRLNDITSHDYFNKRARFADLAPRFWKQFGLTRKKWRDFLLN